MGGRGSSSGRAGRGSKNAETRLPTYFKQTEKAVQLKLSVEDVDLEQTKQRIVWIPKSQLAEDGKPSEWITEQKAQEFYSTRRSKSQYKATWEDATGEKFSSSQTKKEKEIAEAKEKKIKASADKYNNFVNMAKSAGVKGVRNGMRVQTIIKLINNTGINYSYEDYQKRKKI